MKPMIARAEHLGETLADELGVWVDETKGEVRFDFDFDRFPGLLAWLNAEHEGEEAEDRLLFEFSDGRRASIDYRGCEARYPDRPPEWVLEIAEWLD